MPTFSDLSIGGTHEERREEDGLSGDGERLLQRVVPVGDRHIGHLLTHGVLTAAYGKHIYLLVKAIG